MKVSDDAIIRLVHWNEAEAAERAGQLQAFGYRVESGLPQGPRFFKELGERPPAAVVIDLGRLPSQGRDLGIHMRTRAATRGIRWCSSGESRRK